MKKYLIGLGILVGLIYLFLQSLSIFGGDAGDLVTASYIGGIPHPPGFPLYTFLGWLLIKLPLFTPAWRVSLLSSIPAVIAHIVLFLCLVKLTKSYFFSLIGALIYSFLYPVWLFAEVPEIISLNTLFLTVALYLTISFYQTKQKTYLYLLVLSLGLAIFHNYIIILFLPSIAYILYSKKNLNILKKNRLRVILLFFAGALPYLYAVIASLGYPVLDRDHPASLTGLIKLITRASYGTFRLSHDIYFNINNAASDLFNFFNFIRIDFKLIGIVFFILGGGYLFLTNRKIFFFLLINLLNIMIFFAYASFPFAIPFHWGTFEKYLPMPYIYITIFIVFGFIGSRKIIDRLIQNSILNKICLIGLTVSFFIYIGILFNNNLKRIYALKNDFTAENLAQDILISAPKDSMVFLNSDTALYNTLYARYVLKTRTDVKIVDLNLLQESYYRTYLKKNYPRISLSDPSKDVRDFIGDFLEGNASQTEILSDKPMSIGTWLPHGLLWKYYSSNSQLPKPDQLIYVNLALWQKYHSPLRGSLSKYQSLLLSDVLRVYAIGHESFGMLLSKNKQNNLAANEFRDALNYLPEQPDNHINLAKTYIDSGECQEAEKILDEAKKRFESNKEVYKTYIDLYGNCFKNENKAIEYINAYKKLQK